jgi:hypothetical protein
MKVFLKCIPLLALGLMASACGIYSFSPGGKSEIETIAVTQFENKTVETGLSARMTDLVVDAFLNDGNLRVVSESEADAVLLGTLTSYRREAYTYDETDNVSQYVVKLVFDVVLQKGGEDEELWKEAFYSEGIYDANVETEDDGQVRAADKLVVDIINRTAKSW